MFQSQVWLKSSNDKTRSPDGPQNKMFLQATEMEMNEIHCQIPKTTN
jgi:hypothetical protein